VISDSDFILMFHCNYIRLACTVSDIMRTSVLIDKNCINRLNVVQRFNCIFDPTFI